MTTPTAESGGPGRAPSRSRAGFVLKVVALVVALAVLGKVLSHADWKLARASLGSIEPLALVLVVLPFALGLLAESASWKVLLVGRGASASLARIFRVRLATESLTIAIPAGGLIAEVLGALLLAPNPPVSIALATATAKRWLTVRMHGTYVLLGAALAFGTLSAHSHELVGHGALPWLVAVTGLALIGVSVGVERATSRLGVAQKLHDGVERVRRSPWFRRFATGGTELDRTAFARVDEELLALSKGHHPLAAAFLLVQWLLETATSWIILRILGVDIAFTSILACDAVLTVVRALTVFAPSGLGVQDLGYLAFFSALGVPNAAGIGPAFLVLKRSKELFYVVVGFGLLLATRTRTRSAAPAPTR